MSHRSRKARATALNQPDLFAFVGEKQTAALAPVSELKRQITKADKTASSFPPVGSPARPTQPREYAVSDEANCQSSDFVGTPNVDRRLIEYVANGAKRGRPLKRLIHQQIETGVGCLLDVREAARRLGLSKSTLDKMRCSGRGPRFIRATDRAVRYDPADLDAFADERRRRSTSDEALSALRD
jgi:predicted DNA-binding transcriptional regulator AlpA